MNWLNWLGIDCVIEGLCIQTLLGTKLNFGGGREGSGTS